MSRRLPKNRVRIFRVLVAASVVAGSAACSNGGVHVGQDTASAEGWTWPLTVSSGVIVCDSGTTGPEIAFIPDDLEVAYPLSPNALFAHDQNGVTYPGSLRSIRNGKPLKSLMLASWRVCDYSYGAIDHDVEVMDKKG